jgi:ribosomal-protein-alanine N-acetyltransferase
MGRDTSPRVWLEAAAADDAEALGALETRCFGQGWTARDFREAAADTLRTRVLVLREPWERSEAGRGIVAYAVARVVVDEMEVLNVAVGPEARGAGLGRLLLTEVLRLGRRRGARTAYLEVRETNRAALRLYESMGFRRQSRRRRYYSQPLEDAVVLSLALE